ncbi:hypothetical protein [Stenotrophomonas sp. SAU14A_NAIMI4_5]|uniref:hypothetical protein n=1 Tax=Stenotrophomonas sp. SAU14A_NAIMI4_5 TaxID=2072413 RepID=UPI00131F4578|nr:hypothetical protein [Stenotrophomonas sp. SAU14A_NAIMI4_5]
MAKESVSQRGVKLRLENQRWIHDVERRRKRRVVKAKINNQEKDAENKSKRYRSKPLGLMAGKSHEVLVRDSVIAGKVIVPRSFSVHHNPRDTLLSIFRIAKYARQNKGSLRVNIDLSRVTEMDLAADSLLAIVLKEIKNESFGLRKVSIRGSFPRQQELQREMEEVGTVKVLMSDRGKDNVEFSLKGDVKVFRHRQASLEPTRTIDASDSVEAVTEKFSDHVNNCLNTINKELTANGRRNLCDYVGELLTNAQDHAGMTDWTIVGYLDVATKLFKVVVVNFGSSIEETFTALEDGYTRDQVYGYVQRHKDAAFRKYRMREGALYTVAALQGKVSSKNFDESGTRGQGTIAMMEFFQRISDACSDEGTGDPEMVLVSGDTHIRFHRKYKMKKDEATGREIIAFNKENSTSELPDGELVRTMVGASFPGTLISINFPLSGKLQIREIE